MSVVTGRSHPLAWVLAAALVVVACSGAASPGPGATPAATIGGTLTVYSGRSEELVKPLFERFATATGIVVRASYGDTAELAATILEEGARSPADVYFAQDAGALGALAAEDRLAPLPVGVLDRVDPRFRSPDGVWVGVSGRARVAEYNPTRVTEADLPASILGFTDPVWRGRIGWAPTNGSFQSFVTALRIELGDDAAKEWLEGVVANEPRVYEGNTPALQAVAAGEVDVAFVNHYYLMRQLAERGDAYPARNHYFSGGDPGALVNVAGVGILVGAPNPTAAEAFAAFLLEDESQRYFAETTFEYPLVPGIAADARLVPLAEIRSPDIDLSDLADLAGTLRVLREAGVL